MGKKGVDWDQIRPSERGDKFFHAAYQLLRPVYHLLFEVEFRGLEKLPQDRGIIVASNHLSQIDAFTLAYPLFKRGLTPRFMAKESLFRLPVLGWILRSFSHIPVSRGSAQAARSLQVAQRILEAQGSVAIFPEGTLTSDPESWPMTAKTGSVRLALETGAPIYPIAHWGGQEVWPYSAKLPHLPRKRQKVTIVVGDPIDFSGLDVQKDEQGRYSQQTLAQATEMVMAALTDLLEDIRGIKAPEGRWNHVLGLRQVQDGSK